MVKKTRIKSFILLFLIFFTLVAFGVYFQQKREVVPAAKKNLSSIAKVKTEKIVDFFNDQAQAFITETKIDQFIFSPSTASASGLAPHLGDSISRVRMTLATDISTFSVNPKTNQPEIYISFPLFQNQKVQGVLSALVNTAKVYELIQDPTGLGESGTIVLFKETVTNDMVLISPLRNEPNSAFKKQVPVKEAPIFYQKALAGTIGTQVGIDGAGIECIAAWEYIPEVNWGIVVKMNLDEILGPIRIYHHIFYILLAVTIVYCIYFLLTSRQFLQAISPERIQIFRTRLIFGILSVISAIGLVFLSYSIYDYIRGQEEAFEEMRNKAQIQAEKVSQSLNYDLYRVQTIGKSIADDLSKEQLTPQELERRMQIDLRENYQLFGILVAYAPDEGSAAPFAAEAIRNGSSVEFNQLKTSPLDPAGGWYLQAINQGETWLTPHMDPLGKKLVAIFSAPIYEKGTQKPIGAVLSFVEVEQLKELGPSLQVSDTSYGFIVSPRGTFIYHPTENYVFAGKKIFDIAHEMGSTDLVSIAQKATQGQKGYELFNDPKTGQSFWVYYLSIPTANWELGIVINQAEIIPPVEQLQKYYLNIVLASTFSLIALTGLLCRIHTGKHHRLRLWSPITCGILALSITCFWIVVQRTSITTVQDGVIIDKLQLNRFLSNIRESSLQNNLSPPIAVPTGIFIYTFEFPESNHINFSGYVWQRYHDTLHQGLERDIVFPEAFEVKKEEAYREKEGEVETIGWRVNVLAPQEIDFGKYPIDVIRASVLMQHKDVEKNVILIPDLDGYSNMRPNAKPGLSSFFSLNGFSIKNTFFRTEVEKSMTNFGIVGLKRNDQLTNLLFNIQMERNILQALIVYLLPLLVALVAMFVCFWIINRAASKGELQTADILTAIVIYTALIFALILLHTALRDRFVTSSVLYLEYFFFTTYFTTFMLICHALLMYGQFKFHKKLLQINSKIHVHFWQFQFTLWFLITAFIFY